MPTTHIQPDDLLEAPFWPEPVRVLTVKPLGSRVQIEAVGRNSQQLFTRLLSADDLAQVHRITVSVKKSPVNAEPFFLTIETHRIRLAYQFDPLFAVNVSQVDPLPHQIEAVYHYLLRSPRIRFLLADDPRAPARPSWPACFSRSSNTGVWSGAR